MSYLVLARKWRPRTFSEVVGQDTVVRTLTNAVSSGRLGHAFLLCGARGVGKTTTARILAKALNCSTAEGPTPEPCLRCPSCEEVAAGTCLDVQEIDGASNAGVEEVRVLCDSARYNPARDRFKVWIIDEVHMLSTNAFNALLKTLEEPPPRVKFIFATTEYHKLPDTILSRCQQYDFRLVPAREIAAHLRRVAGAESIQVSDGALSRLARAAEGSVRDALSLFDQVLAFSGREVRDDDIAVLLGLIDRELLLAASQAVARSDSLAVLELVERLADYGADHRAFARELLLYFRELLLLKMAPATSALLAQVLPEERERMSPLAEAFSEEDLLRAFEVLTQAEEDLRRAQDPRVTLELGLLKLAQMRKLVPFAELVERVERLAPGRPASPPRAPDRPASAAPSLARSPSRPSSRTGDAPSAAPGAGVAAAASPADALLAGMAAQARPSLAPSLRAARARLDGDVLSLEFAGDYAAFASLHLDEYRHLAGQVAGRRLDVNVEHAPGPQPPGGAPSPAETRREELLDQARREPAVQEVLDLFGGTLVEVREEDPS
jgi:DNA polymerase-3 subunit gamma/tau